MFAQYFEYYAIILRGAVFCGHSVGLQSMLVKCFDVACDLSLQFNVNKCHIIVFGKK